MGKHFRLTIAINFNESGQINRKMMKEFDYIDWESPDNYKSGKLWVTKKQASIIDKRIDTLRGYVKDIISRKEFKNIPRSENKKSIRLDELCALFEKDTDMVEIEDHGNGLLFFYAIEV